MPHPADPRIDWYDHPALYDLLYASSTVQETDFLEAMMRLHSTAASPPGPRRVLEPGCGSGRLVVALAQRGWQVCGFDLSAPMLQFAQQRLSSTPQLPPCELQQANMASFAVRGHFELAHCLVSTFKYLLDPAQALTHLRTVAAALRPGGLYVLGFHLSHYGRLASSTERCFGASPGIKVSCQVTTGPANPDSRLEPMRSRLYVRQGRRSQRFETHWAFRTYDAGQVQAMLQQVPELAHIATYDFGYTPTCPRQLDGRRQDCVLILKRL